MMILYILSICQTHFAGLVKKYDRLMFMDSGGVSENVTPDNFALISECSRKACGVVEGDQG